MECARVIWGHSIVLRSLVSAMNFGIINLWVCVCNRAQGVWRKLLLLLILYALNLVLRASTAQVASLFEHE